VGQNSPAVWKEKREHAPALHMQLSTAYSISRIMDLSRTILDFLSTSLGSYRLEDGNPAGVATQVLQAHADLRPRRLEGEALGPLKNGHRGSGKHILHAESLKIVEIFDAL
jgi:hypothetical protein